MRIPPEEQLLEILQAEQLTKRFDEVTAVAGVSFGIYPGEIFGFLGPNGAGKTTTINLLTGLARPDDGKLYLNGEEYTRNRKRAQALMGVVPDESNLYDELTGYENLTFCAALYGTGKKKREQRAEELLEQFGLADAGGRSFKTYSKGMKRKLTIAAGIIHEPKILFLDEPTTGIDVMSARQIRSLIGELNRGGTTIFLTTHYIEEAERLCSRIAFIAGGKIIRTGTLEELMREHEKESVLQLAFDGEQSGADLAEALGRRFPSYRIERGGSGLIRVISDTQIDLLPLLEFLSREGTAVSEAKLIRPSLEEVFVRVTGIEAEKMRQEREGKKK